MGRIDFNNAFYLKLGRKGMWESELENGNKARIGWSNISIDDLIKNNWEKIHEEIKFDFAERGKKTGVTQDYNALKLFCEAKENDVLITFFDGLLYWSILSSGSIKEDGTSKYRNLKHNWRNTDIDNNLLRINSISGKITKTQGYRATLCKIEEKEALSRIINGEVSPLVKEINQKEIEIQNLLTKAFGELYWKDCEILTDLIFNQSGWQRISTVGKSMKFMDIELENPITKERYQVQVKANATIKDFKNYAENFSDKNYSKLFFVSFNNDISLERDTVEYENVIILKGNELAKLIISLGLTRWVVDRIA